VNEASISLVAFEKSYFATYLRDAHVGAILRIPRAVMSVDYQYPTIYTSYL
jgi:hypothetical protein